MSWFVMREASSTVLPLTISVSAEAEAMALPQPNVLNFASSITPVRSFDFQEELQRVAASERADLAHAAGLLDLAHVPRMEEMILEFLGIVPHGRLLLSAPIPLAPHYPLYRSGIRAGNRC